jgi:hypothetical protein
MITTNPIGKDHAVGTDIEVDTQALDSITLSQQSNVDQYIDWSKVKTFINACKCFIGASAFELPWAVKKGGLSGSFFGLIAFAVVSWARPPPKKINK